MNTAPKEKVLGGFNRITHNNSNKRNKGKPTHNQSIQVTVWQLQNKISIYIYIKEGISTKKKKQKIRNNMTLHVEFTISSKELSM